MPIHLKQRLLKSLSGQWLYMVRIAGQQLEIMNLFSILWRLEFFELRLGYQINAGVRNMEVGSIFDKIVQTRLRGDWNAWSVVRRAPKSWKLRGNQKKQVQYERIQQRTPWIEKIDLYVFWSGVTWHRHRDRPAVLRKEKERDCERWEVSSFLTTYFHYSSETSLKPLTYKCTVPSLLTCNFIDLEILVCSCGVVCILNWSEIRPWFPTADHIYLFGRISRKHIFK